MFKFIKKIILHSFGVKIKNGGHSMDWVAYERHNTLCFYIQNIFKKIICTLDYRVVDLNDIDVRNKIDFTFKLDELDLLKKYNINGKKAIYISDINTNELYRNSGLARKILDALYEHYKCEVDIYFLMASPYDCNMSVYKLRNIYEKLGYKVLVDYNGYFLMFKNQNTKCI